jgi:thymidylate kinase
MAGMLITFEGVEGSGKTTLVGMVSDRLRACDREIVATREPGGVAIAEQIRALILDAKNASMDPRTEALLFAAARRQHFVEKIKPALDRGAIVLCDRFVDSSLAYQGIARGIGAQRILEINQFATDCRMPDLTFYLDIEPEKGLARIAKNGRREVNRLDMEKLEFHRKVREGYLWVAKQFPNRIVVLDAEKTLDQLAEEVVSHAKNRITC